jgi:phospholipid/cholesterol/gamma-HCH transport system substrate-binding protein
MELRYRREAAVGMMLILGTAAFVVLMMWLRGKSFRSGEIIHVVFDDVSGLKEGDPVRTSGVAVGSVKQIRLVRPGAVDVYFDVQSGPPPRDDAKAEIRSADLFGARVVEYFPGVSATPLPSGQVVRGTRLQDMSEMAAGLSGQAKDLLVNANAVSRELRAALVSTQALLATLNSGAATTTDRLGGALDELRRAIQRVDVMLAQNGPVAADALRGMRDVTAHADSLTRSLTHTSAQFDSILAKVNSGRGPAAALLNDSTIVQDLMATNAALRELLTDFRANPSRYIRLRL